MDNSERRPSDMTVTTVPDSEEKGSANLRLRRRNAALAWAVSAALQRWQ